MKPVEIRDKYIPKAVYNVHKIIIEKAKDFLLYDDSGKEYIDFTGSIGVLNVGNANEAVVEAIKEQAEKFTHACFHTYMHRPYIELVKLLTNITPGDFEKMGVLFNSGAEAVENAIKVARHYTERPGIITFDYAFHGRTISTLSLTSKVNPYKKGFGPFLPEVYRVSYPYCYRGEKDFKDEKECTEFYIKLLEEHFIKYFDPETIAAVVIEPILGEGGFVVAPDLYLKKLREITEKYGILLIVDEVQSGFCRTGSMFYWEKTGLDYDIMTLGKSIAGGLPLSAIIGKKELMENIQEGGLGGTFGGNPVASSAAIAAINFIRKNNLCERANKIGEEIVNSMKELSKKSKYIGDIRGKGAMIGVEFVKDKKTKEPFKEFVKKTIIKAREKGLLLISCGVYGNVIRTLMPLTISDNYLKKAIDILKNSILEVEKDYE